MNIILTFYFRISIITLAPNHPIIKDKKTITKVNYQVTRSVNRLENKVTGKGKKVRLNMTKVEIGPVASGAFLSSCSRHSSSLYISVTLATPERHCPPTAAPHCPTPAGTSNPLPHTA